MVEKKRIESIYSSLDIGSNSVLTFTTFLLIANYFNSSEKDSIGIDLIGYFGLILSVAALVETIQAGLYENPAFLGYGIGYKSFKLSIVNLSPFIIVPILAINQLVLSGYFIASILYCFTHVLLHNIRIYDYKKNNVSTSTLRSLIIFTMQIGFFSYIYFMKPEINLNHIFFGISIIRLLLITLNYKKIFAITYSKNNEQNLNFLFTSLLSIVRSRLPLWLLLPFGLGLVGIYETFRTLMEIYLSPFKPINLILRKNLTRDGPKNILLFGIVCGTLTAFLVGTTYFYITNLEIYNIPELQTLFPYLSLISMTFFFWISEVTGFIFQFNGFMLFESKRRFIPILVFLITGLVLFNFLNLNIFLFLISTIYVLECIISITSRSKLKIHL
jgi:hypothetical protein